MPDYQIALVLSGGNALGAYHAGVYEALHESGIQPDWVVGASIGAITGAIIAGNRREDRLDRLRALWQPAGPGSSPASLGWMPETMRRTMSVMWTMAVGRPGIFAPLGPLGSWWLPDVCAGSPSLYESAPLGKTLERLIDFDLLQSGSVRYAALAVDIETGEEVIFDTRHQRVKPDHIRASAALLTAFPAIEIDGRAFVDGGLSSNLPLDPVLGEHSCAPLLCIAVDLLPLTSGRPKTLGDVAGRMQDLVFAAQSRRTMEHWKRRYEADSQKDGSLPPVTLVRLSYTDQGAEVAGKAMDFSSESVRRRWAAGLKDGQALVSRLKAGDIRTGLSGLAIADEAME
ncbi:hypothetical protein sphantq_04285 [Sphingobium sp. AntQ-1]|uniref:patatin-like phospholipase family protein n=1 Tax=Sphingobium sp. AntQ-1 TaxID=2930091 RepID=UPI00234EAB50|nr:patatin-like phospholipase family protein [Sphingobium sp. AntQ-1]WCP15797.1 hypothetical protein sphantq_04285 [Sphingobium sp. AntQ-1]